MSDGCCCEYLSEQCGGEAVVCQYCHDVLKGRCAELMERMEAMLARMEGESEWLVRAGYSGAWMVQRHDTILAPARALINKTKGA